VPEEFQYKGHRFALKEPIACFTEWSLGQSLIHTAEYGRIGFGFPKRWVIERGGQSVTYFRHSERGSFLHSIFRLLQALAREGKDGDWIASNHAFTDLRYVLHFAKMIREKKALESRRLPAPAAMPQRLAQVRKKKPTQAARDTQTFGRKFGRPLRFVQEREWRIVYHGDNKRFVKGPGCPEYYLPYVPGEELFTLVLPDNKVVSRVLQSDWFVERLFEPWKHYRQLSGRRVPPVTLLAHTDIGTF
jgi:hypothetical protein